MTHIRIFYSGGDEFVRDLPREGTGSDHIVRRERSERVTVNEIASEFEEAFELFVIDTLLETFACCNFTLSKDRGK